MQFVNSLVLHFQLLQQQFFALNINRNALFPFTANNPICNQLKNNPTAIPAANPPPLSQVDSMNLSTFGGMSIAPIWIAKLVSSCMGSFYAAGAIGKQYYFDKFFGWFVHKV